MIRILFSLVLVACTFEHGTLEPVTDAAGVDGDAEPSDGRSVDTPPDAFACTSHGQCSAMTSGTCCVSPGPMGHCEHGTVIATVCVLP